MTVGDVKSIAKEWVTSKENQIENFYAAFFSGSLNFHSDDHPWSKLSDVDLRIVIDGEIPDGCIHRKFVYRDVVIDPWYATLSESLSAENILKNAWLGYHFSVPCVISDPSGNLTRVQQAVAKEFNRRGWVEKRCENSRETVTFWSQKAADPNQGPIGPKDGSEALMFTVAGVVDIPVLAALAIPTARKCMIVVRDVLTQYGFPEMYEEILHAQGYLDVEPGRCTLALSMMTKAYDYALTVMPVSLDRDTYVSAWCRPYAVDGAREMIADGNHRESITFILWMFREAITEIDTFAPGAEARQYVESYRTAMSDFGLASKSVIRQRAGSVADLVPAMSKAAHDIIDQNDRIVE